MAACRESGLTWTSVTSTSTRRGSSNSKPTMCSGLCRVTAALSPCADRLPLVVAPALIAAQRHFDGGVPGIRADLDVGYFHFHEARIFQFKADDLVQFLFYRFGDP